MFNLLYNLDRKVVNQKQGELPESRCVHFLVEEAVMLTWLRFPDISTEISSCSKLIAFKIRAFLNHSSCDTIP